MASMSEEVDIQALSVKALRELITSAGLSFVGLVEKDELRARAKEAQELLGKKKAASGGGSKSASSSSCQLSGYDCEVIMPDSPDLLVIIFHGFGATKDDFASIPNELPIPNKTVAYCFPQVRHGLTPATV